MSKTLSPEEAAEYLGIKPQTLAVWRSTGRYGLPYVKVGSRVRYRLEDLQAFIGRHTLGASEGVAAHA